MRKLPLIGSQLDSDLWSNLWGIFVEIILGSLKWISDSFSMVIIFVWFSSIWSQFFYLDQSHTDILVSFSKIASISNLAPGIPS